MRDHDCSCPNCCCPLQHLQGSQIYHIGFSNKAHLFEQGEPIDHLYALCSGAIRLARYTQEGKKQILIPWLKPGILLGISQILWNEPCWPFYAEALEACEVRLIPPRILLTALKANPLAFALIRQQTQSVGQWTNRLIHTLGRPTRERLIWALLDLKRETGSSNVSITNDELAALTGSTSVTVSQHICWLKCQDALQRPNGHLSLHPKQLSKIVENY